jgi:hypothetical protein
MEAFQNLHAQEGVLVVDYFEDRIRTKDPVTRPWIRFLHNVPHHSKQVSDVNGDEYDLPLARIVVSTTWA